MKLLNTVLIVMACCVNITVQYNYRLPKDVNPEHYELHIVTDLDNGQPNFHGRVRIKARIILSTDRIIMNCKSLTIKKDDVHVTKDNKNADEIFVSDVEIDSYFNFLIIKFNETLQAGQVFFIQIPFSAQLTNETNGYFRRSYIDKKTGHSSSFAVTRFHASFARKAFPCFDEPNFKSVFSINLGHREKLKSLSNMPSVKILPMKNKKGWVWNKFMDTQQIPVHILNFIVFDLECVCGKLRRNISFCLWARKDNLKKFKTAKELSPEIFGYVEDYFGVNYPLTKYDMIALPKLDFDCVEGLGISILSEELILKEGDLAIDVSVIVAREFISQWFGGLITFKWWSDLWVHEGFLGYFSNVVAANVTKRPYIQKLTFFEQLSSGMKHDNIITMNPLVELVESDNITDISKANSLVESSYNRGALLFRMISLILGENLFQQGISSFFATNNDGFINSDLWKLLTIAGHRSGALSINVRFQDVVDSWVVLPGFPVLVVDYNNNEEKVALHQKHFKYSSSLNWNSISSLNDSNFFIPITYTTSKVKNFKDVRVDNWLTDNVIIFKLKDLGNKDDWIIFNTNILGLYKVQYSNSNWNNIIRGLDSDKHDGIHLFNRYQLVTDIMDFAQSGDVSYELMFNLLSYLRNEEKFEPWKASAFGFQRLIKIIHRTPLMDVFKEYYSELIQPLYAKHNYFTKFPEFSQTQDLFKLTVFALNWACSNDLDDCIDDTKKLFQKWRLGKDLDISLKFTPEVTYIFLCNAIRHGNMGDWNYLITEGNNFTFSKIAPEIIFNALSCSRDTLILSRYLSLILPLRSEEYLPDIAFPFLRLIMENPVGFDIGKTFLLNNFDAFQNSPNIKKLEIGRFFMHLASILISESEVNELRGFLKARGHFFKDYMPDIENSFKESQANIQWYKREHDKLKSVLKESIKNLQKKKDAETRR